MIVRVNNLIFSLSPPAKNSNRAPQVSLSPSFLVEGRVLPDELSEASVLRTERKEKGGERYEARWLGLGGYFPKGFGKGEVSCCMWDSGWEKKKRILKSMSVDHMPLQGICAEIISSCYEMQAFSLSWA